RGRYALAGPRQFAGFRGAFLMAPQRAFRDREPCGAGRCARQGRDRLRRRAEACRRHRRPGARAGDALMAPMRATGAALALALALPVQAQEVDCTAPEVQIEMNYCAEQAWMRADAEMNDAWGDARAYAQALDAELPKAQRGVWQALLDGQRAWLIYRDKT